jgi:hydrogenase maturation factor HypF (carbamoyltransferase family)
MCELCNGTHVVHESNNFSVSFCTCPICGPEPEWIFRSRMADFRRKLEAARKRSLKKGA